jgi:hypothetical protein
VALHAANARAATRNRRGHTSLVPPQMLVRAQAFADAQCAACAAVPRPQIFAKPGRDWAQTDNFINALVLVVDDDVLPCAHASARAMRAFQRPMPRSRS